MQAPGGRGTQGPAWEMKGLGQGLRDGGLRGQGPFPAGTKQGRLLHVLRRLIKSPSSLTSRAQKCRDRRDEPDGSPGEGHPGALWAVEVPALSPLLRPRCHPSAVAKNQESQLLPWLTAVIASPICCHAMGTTFCHLPATQPCPHAAGTSPQPHQRGGSGAAHPCTLHRHLQPVPDRVAGEPVPPCTCSSLTQPGCVARVVSIRAGKPRRGQQPAGSNRPW